MCFDITLWIKKASTSGETKVNQWATAAFFRGYTPTIKPMVRILAGFSSSGSYFGVEPLPVWLIPVEMLIVDMLSLFMAVS